MPDDLLQELRLEECPLMRETPGLIARYNHVVAAFRLVQEDQALMERHDVQNLLKALKRVRDRLTRPRYLVGFVGTTQAAKSTTILSLLAPVPQGEEPVSSGAGRPKTSAITRIRRVLSRPHTLSLRYLTEEKYQEKREKLCKAVNEDATATDDAILQRLPSRLARYSAITGPSLNEAPDQQQPLIQDVETLGCFLNSYKKYGRDQIRLEATGPRIDTDLPFADRERYTDHPPSGAHPLAPMPTALLDDVLIGYHTDRIPVQLEVIDLPGLGSAGSIDTILTKSFLKQLDGALVFLRSDQHGDSNVESILNYLRENYHGKLASRVWLVVTKFDVLTRNALYGTSSSGETTVDGLLDFLKRHHIPASQVCLTCNRLYEKRGPEGTLPLNVALATLDLIADEPIPPRFKENSDLKVAFEALLQDGGIGRLRDLVANVLEKRVAEEIRVETEDLLAQICRGLQAAVEQQQQLASGGLDVLLQVQRCVNDLEEILNSLEENMAYLDQEAKVLGNGLQECFDLFFPNTPTNQRMEAARLAQRFDTHAAVLEQKFKALVRASVLPPVYDRVQEALNSSEFTHVPVIAVTGSASAPVRPMQAWNAYREKDCVQDGLCGNDSFPTFQPDEESRRLFSELGNSSDGQDLLLMTGSDYREMMGEKIRAVNQQTMHALRTQLRRRLQSMINELNKLTDVKNLPNWSAAPAMDYDAVLAEMRMLCPSI